MSTPSASPSATELLALAQEAARAAADLVRERAARTVEVAATKSTDTDVVTEADRASEDLIRRIVAAKRPDDAFLGEEGGQSDGQSDGQSEGQTEGRSGVRWIVDPIDGTVNFLYGIARYAVSVAAERDGEVVAGVVIDVPHGIEFTGYRAADGAIVSRREGKQIQVAAPAPLGKRLVATGFGYDAALRRLQAQCLVRLLPQVRDIRRAGSCALDVCDVAQGTFDGYLEEGVHVWDHAAAGLIAQGAGARVEVATGLGGGRLLLVAPEHGFDELRTAALGAGYFAEA
ncbi:inositol monophosphatase family protein [Nocardioides sp. BP30]|uniref:inositol monophosphatase family protein n=1 Tax=Nocardioides sp. BP30 TaxID=3036374 RepID=UPI002468F682|nr:inositol monophosphatase family protein [Nocardioides sp. BP30]WGL53959.1 inositol monophosphatase family protein [Nocardioides sp. BP30]